MIREKSNTQKKIEYDRIFDENTKEIIYLHQEKKVALIKIAEKFGLSYYALYSRMHDNNIETHWNAQTKCPYCSRLIRNSLFNRHINLHTRNMQGEIRCPQCHSKEVRKNGTRLTKHHGIIQQYICNNCGRAFNDKSIQPKVRTEELCRYVHLLKQMGKTDGEVAEAVQQKIKYKISNRTVREWNRIANKLFV